MYLLAKLLDMQPLFRWFHLLRRLVPRGLCAMLPLRVVETTFTCLPCTAISVQQTLRTWKSAKHPISNEM